MSSLFATSAKLRHLLSTLGAALSCSALKKLNSFSFT